MELLFELLAEFVLQIVFEALAEIGFHSLKNTLRNERNPVLSTIGFFLWGGIAGGISLWLFPHSFIASHSLRLFNLVLTPLIAGLLMMQAGKVRERRGHDLVGLDRFGYAFAFAFAMALIRLIFTK
jgi:hypothetical protein